MTPLFSLMGYVIDASLNISILFVVIFAVDIEWLESIKGRASLLQSAFIVVQSSNLGTTYFVVLRFFSHIDYPVGVPAGILKHPEFGVEWLRYGRSSRRRRGWVEVDVSWHLDGKRSQKKADRILSPIDVHHPFVLGLSTRKTLVDADVPRQRFFQKAVHRGPESLPGIHHLSDFFFEIPHPSPRNFLDARVPFREASSGFERRRSRRRIFPESVSRASLVR
mmetsp:Transcript_29558/g.63364  ORF Transcript_29558/g.63364 Transcript_29558/m.63364 type:complete len:222 (-) Transcript_29558:313-978(-)